ncbi:MAG: hypothetical protein [Cressdnaviricota sp.]|nr:MAG: hypothetical protein [Cressdnaviricota sp.]
MTINQMGSTISAYFHFHLQHPQYVYPHRIQLWLLIFTITFMLSITRMLSVKRGGVIILTHKMRQLPPLLFGFASFGKIIVKFTIPFH